MKVFLSSTFRDLVEYRRIADDVLQREDGYIVIRMEDFGARDHDADDFCRQKVAEADVYVGILGPNYGSIHESSGKSYTEREFDMAVACGKPRLIFLTANDFAVPENMREPDALHELQRRFREKSVKAVVRDTFSSPSDLAYKLSTAVHNVEREHSLASLRGETGSSTAILPLPPQPYFAHPYPMQPNFTGRVKERKMLTDWFTQDVQPIYVIEAIGGMGKSALTWAWLQTDLLGFPLPGTAPAAAPECRVPDAARPSGVLWWSFYEERAAFPFFVNEALRYLSDGKIDPTGIPTDYDRTQTLLTLLERRSVLLILDGFERELGAYANMNSAYSGDEVKEDKRGEFRACINPFAGALLRGIAAAPMRSWVLMTTRLFPKELSGNDHRALAGCHHECLGTFQPPDAVTFIQSQGINGTRAEIEAVCEHYGCHPLTLRLLSGLILRSAQHKKDIRAAEHLDPVPEAIAREHHVLELSYNSLSKPLQSLLSGLAAFRAPVNYDAIKAISPFKTDKLLESALNELLERGLLFYIEAAERYDLHPIVRRYAYDRLTDKQEVHSRLRDYFKAVPGPGKKITSLDELQPVIELYHHTVRAGQYHDARDLYGSRLRDTLYFQLGAYLVIIELLTALFPDGEDRPPLLKSKIAQGWALSELANSYDLSGQSRRAVALFESAIAVHESAEGTGSAVAMRYSLSYLQTRLGSLQNVEAGVKFVLAALENKMRRVDEGWTRFHLFHSLGLRGKLEESAAEAKAVHKLFEDPSAIQSVELVLAFQAHIGLVSGNSEEALQHLRESDNLWKKVASEKFPHERDRVQLEWLFGWAKTLLAAEGEENRASLLPEAECHLTEALTSCRRINLVELEGDILLAWSRWHLVKGSIPEAFKAANEALEIADRSEYRLQQADIHNMLAKLYLKTEDKVKAKEHAEIGRERAECDGPGYRYQSAYDEAERLLKEIG